MQKECLCSASTFQVVLSPMRSSKISCVSSISLSFIHLKEMMYKWFKNKITLLRNSEICQSIWNQYKDEVSEIQI